MISLGFEVHEVAMSGVQVLLLWGNKGRDILVD